MASSINKFPFRDDARLIPFHRFAKSKRSVKVVRDDSTAPSSSKSSRLCRFSAKIGHLHQRSYQNDIPEDVFWRTETCRSLDLRVLPKLPKFHAFHLTTNSRISQGIKGCISDEVSNKHRDARLFPNTAGRSAPNISSKGST